MKKQYIAPELKLSAGELDNLIMVNLSIKVAGEVFDGNNSHGTIDWGGETVKDDEADTRERGWDIFGGE